MVFLCPCEVCLAFLHIIRRVIIRILLLFLLLWAVVAGQFCHCGFSRIGGLI